MDVSQYRKKVMGHLSTGAAKKGLRVMSGNKRMLNLGHAMVGVAAGSGEVLKATELFVLGVVQMSDEVRARFRDELGGALMYTVSGAKELKVKIPSSTKKVKPKHTMSELILKLDSISTDLLILYKDVYLGHGLGEATIEVPRTKEELKIARDKAAQRAAAQGKSEFPEPKATKRVDSPAKVEFLAKVQALWEVLVPTVYELSWSILGEPVATVMDESAKKLGDSPAPEQAAKAA